MILFEQEFESFTIEIPRAQPGFVKLIWKWKNHLLQMIYLSNIERFLTSSMVSQKVSQHSWN